jgi:hypothetical protein
VTSSLRNNDIITTAIWEYGLHYCLMMMMMGVLILMSSNFIFIRGCFLIWVDIIKLFIKRTGALRVSLSMDWAADESSKTEPNTKVVFYFSYIFKKDVVVVMNETPSYICSYHSFYYFYGSRIIYIVSMESFHI